MAPPSAPSNLATSERGTQRVKDFPSRQKRLPFSTGSLSSHKSYLTYSETKAKLIATLGVCHERIRHLARPTPRYRNASRIRRLLLRYTSPLLGLRNIPPRPGIHCAQHCRGPRCLRGDAHRRREVAVLPIAGSPRFPAHRGRDFPTHRSD